MKMRSSIKIAFLCLIGPILFLSGCWTQFNEAIVQKADQHNTFELLTASAAAYRKGRLEDAGFLFLAGKARYQIDKRVFPPQARENPGILKAALTASIGQGIQGDLENDPIAFLNAVARLGKWSPKFNDGYDPGWKHKKPLDEIAIANVLAVTLKPIVSAAKSKATLAQNEEYAKLSQIVKDAGIVERKYWAAQEGKGKRDTDLDNEYDAAMDRKIEAARRMKEIEFESCPDSRWHARVGWKVEDFFKSPQVIALCQAIGKNDLADMKRLIANGADVNAVGDGGMTPLLWAFPDRKIERFQILLENGANPNVIIEKDLGTRGLALHPYPTGGSFYLDRGCPVRSSVTHLAARSPLPKYLELVMEHGGDPNLVDKGTGMVPLDIVMERSFTTGLRNRVELLLSKGADVDHYCKYKGGTPAMLAVRNDDYEVALILLKAGADPKLYHPNTPEKLVHLMVRSEKRLESFRPQLAADFNELRDWLEEHGESLAKARADCESWDKRHKKSVSSKSRAQIRQQIIDEQKRTGRPEAKPIVAVNPEKDDAEKQPVDDKQDQEQKLRGG